MARKTLWVQPRPRGWVLYDADCGFCTRWAWRIALFVGPRGFHLAPLQAPWVRRRLALPESELLDELRVLTADDMIYGGADALLYLARQIWWARPLAALARLPGVMPLARAAYRWVARHRHALSSTCALGGSPAGPAQSIRRPLTQRPSGAHR